MAISAQFLLLLSFLCCLSQTACAVTASVGDVFNDGPYGVAPPVPVKKGGALPVDLWVAFPERPGRYPVVQFQHGFLLHNTDYTGLLSQVVSWGFIVVAPQMYGLSTTTEIENARSVLHWMKTGLTAQLPANCTPDFEKVALAGHSRGGQVVFGLALNYGNGNGNTSQKYSAIVGLDPVDDKPSIILTHKEDSIDVGVPTLIVGTRLGPEWNWFKIFPIPPCAPKDKNHINFYTDLKPASVHFVTTDNGHMDMTDDCRKREIAVRCFPCRAGPSRQPMRQFSAGITVAFLQNVLLHDSSALSAALTRAVIAPVPVDLPQCKGNIGNLTCPPKAHQYAAI